AGTHEHRPLRFGNRSDHRFPPPPVPAQAEPMNTHLAVVGTAVSMGPRRSLAPTPIGVGDDQSHITAPPPEASRSPAAPAAAAGGGGPGAPPAPAAASAGTAPPARTCPRCGRAGGRGRNGCRCRTTGGGWVSAQDRAFRGADWRRDRSWPPPAWP